MSNVRFIGLDVHAETIAVAVAEASGEVRSLGVIPNRPESIRTLVKKLGPPEQLRVCYEAGPTGYVVYWQLVALEVRCEVVAPTLVPVKPGDRVKTDRRDALKLARSYRAGDLTPVWVPDAAHEALRDLVRAREAAKKDQLRARHRLGKFLLRQGRRSPTATKAWTQRHLSVEIAFAFHSVGSKLVIDQRTNIDVLVTRDGRRELIGLDFAERVHDDQQGTQAGRIATFAVLPCRKSAERTLRRATTAPPGPSSP